MTPPWTPEEVRRQRLRMGYFGMADGALFVGVSTWFLLGSWSWIMVAILVVGVVLIVLGLRRVRTLRSGAPLTSQA